MPPLAHWQELKELMCKEIKNFHRLEEAGVPSNAQRSPVRLGTSPKKRKDRDGQGSPEKKAKLAEEAV